MIIIELRCYLKNENWVLVYSTPNLDDKFNFFHNIYSNGTITKHQSFEKLG